MADLEKKLIITADTSGVESSFNVVSEKIGRDAREMGEKINDSFKSISPNIEEISKRAEELAEDLLKDSTTRFDNSKDIIRNIKEQVSELEKLSRLETASKRIELKERIAENPKDKSAIEELRQVNLGDKAEQIHNDLLKQILDAIINTSKNEIKADRERVIDELKNVPEEEATAKQRLQERLLQEQDLEDGRGREEKMTGGRKLLYGSRQAAGIVVGSGNAVDLGLNSVTQGGAVAGEVALASGASMATLGIIAAAVVTAMAAKELWTQRQKYELPRAHIRSVSGREMSETGFGYSPYGYSATDFANLLEPLAKQRRSSIGVEASARGQILFEKGIDMDKSQYASMDQLSLLGNSSAYKDIQSAIYSMKESGIVKGNDMSPVSDFLQIMINLDKEQVFKLGKIDVGMNMKVVSSLASMDEMLKKSPEALSTMVNSVKEGLSNSSSPQVEAAKLSVLGKLKPNSTLYERYEMLENPLAVPGFLQEMQKFIKTISGRNKESEMFLTRSIITGNGAFSMARKLQEGGSKFAASMKEDFTGKEGVEGIERRAMRGTTYQEGLDAAATNLKVGLTGIGVDTKELVSYASKSLLQLSGIGQILLGIKSLLDDNKNNKFPYPNSNTPIKIQK